MHWDVCLKLIRFCPHLDLSSEDKTVTVVRVGMHDYYIIDEALNPKGA